MTKSAAVFNRRWLLRGGAARATDLARQRLKSLDKQTRSSGKGGDNPPVWGGRTGGKGDGQKGKNKDKGDKGKDGSKPKS